jgi:hypothetical protein
MKTVNLLAAGVLAAAFTGLAMAPLTRSGLHLDTRAAGGARPLGQTLLALGVRPEPGFGPGPAAPRPEPAELPESPLDVQIASATRLPAPLKWQALKRLVEAFPAEPAVHATLLRFACKNGGSVGIGRTDETAPLLSEPVGTSGPGSGSDPDDIAWMRRSAAAGERLDPDNAYFPAMAAIAAFAARMDDDAYAALRRAAARPAWREYIDVEAWGALHRAERLYGPQSSVESTARLGVILFPHYAQLRAMSRLVAAQALAAELSGDRETGLERRRLIWQLGATMRREAAPVIGGLVGMAITQSAALRPGGAPLPGDRGSAAGRDAAAQTLETYLNRWGKPGEAAAWRTEQDAQATVRRLVAKDTAAYPLDGATMAQGGLRLVLGEVLLSGVLLFSVLGAIGHLLPVLGRRLGRGAVVATLGFYGVGVGLLGWNAWGNLRDIQACVGVFSSLEDTPAARVAGDATVLLANLAILAAVVPVLVPALACAVAALRCRPVGRILRAAALPMATVLTLVYGAHLIDRAHHDLQAQRALEPFLIHEGRARAAALGTAWPD